MTTVSSLVLAVDSKQVKTAATDLDRLAKAGEGAEKAGGGVAAAFSGLRGVLSAAAIGATAVAVLRQADAFNNLNARLALATTTSQQFVRAQQAVFAIAQQTGTGLEQTADLYGALARSTERLGVSQDAVLGVTKTINQALTVSGASAAGAAAALVQLGQGFASGALRGEELNSVLEQAPRLAKAIADGLGVQVGQLRKLGEQGKLTADAVFQALQRSGAQIEQEFATLPLTVGRATTQLGNSLLVLIGNIDKVTGTSGAIASWVQSASGSFDKLSERVKTTGGFFKGFLNILREDFVKERIVGIGRDLEDGAEAFARAQRTLRAQPDSIRAKETVANYRELQESLAAYRKELEGFGKTAGQGGRPANEGGGRYVPTPAAMPGEKKPASEAEKYLESLRKQLQATQDLTVAETVLADIKAGRLKLSNGVTQQELLGVAAQIDAAKRRQDQFKAEEDQLADFLRSRRELADEGRKVFDNTRTSAEKLATETERLNFLVKEGAISWETYGRASSKGLDDVLAGLEKQLDAIPKILPEVKQVDNGFKELGATFSSAFEDAVVSGKKFSDVLKGLYQDILRIALRKTITEPAGDYLSQLFSGGFSSYGGAGVGTNNTGGSLPTAGGRAIGGPVSRGSMYPVLEKGQPELLTAGGKSYLMTGAQGGQVTPMQASESAPVINVNIAGDATPQTARLVATLVQQALMRERRQRAYAGA